MRSMRGALYTTDEMGSFTPNQERAIHARGNVLVQAGAGAGKTRTLVQRCIEWLLEDPGNSLDQILMVTFTEAAAAEMRQRIRAELNSALTGQSDTPHVLAQLALLDSAHISTLHSFCFQLVRQHFYELELDPQLAVMAEEETRVLARDVLADVLKRHYSGALANSKAVLELIQVQGRGWDQPIRRLVLRLHEYTQTLSDPEAWFSRQFAMFRQPEPRQWMTWLRELLPDWRDACLRELQYFANTPAVARAISAVKGLHPQATLPAVHAALVEIVAAGDKDKTELWPPGTIGRVRDQIEDFFEEAEFLESLTGDEPESAARDPDSCPKALLEDWQWSREGMITLLELTREFARAFAEAKRELGEVDFHDLEQFSLRLLWDAASQQPTPLAEHWRSKLRLIFVDEYQDINAAQDAILRALGREGAEANRFLVGDVKQSIYRFRLADPHIFQHYAASWGRGTGEVIPLQDNFRSHEGILEFINLFFAALMRQEIGGVAFGPDARLKFGNCAGRQQLTWKGEIQAGVVSSNVSHVELNLLLTGDTDRIDATADENGDNGLADIPKADQEARMIGLRLRELRAGQFKIWDDTSKQYRPVDWHDMVILLRSRKNKVESFAKEFARLEIPLLAPRGGFFESTEVMDLLNVLKLLDNPLQDIETIAVLRSPLVGLALDELATIRLAAKGRFWMALQKFYRSPWSVAATSEQASTPGTKIDSGHGPRTTDHGQLTTFRKVERFLESFNRWRRLAREGSIAHCLERILDETQYPIWLLTQPRSAQRQSNVAKLLTWARQFDRQHRQGLFRFLRFIEGQRDAEIDHEPAPAEIGNAVRLMTIHQSKGLEFPVVVVADLGKNFNLSDLRGEIIIDEKYGLSPLIKPPSAGQHYPSLPYWLARRRQRTEALGEELRILYVAMSRACHTLILSGATSRTRAKRHWPDFTGLTTRTVLRASSCLDWLGPWLFNATERADWLNVAKGENRIIRWQIYEEGDQRLRPLESASVQDKACALELLDHAQLEMLRARLSWKYPFIATTTEPAKATVSGLRRRALEQTDIEVPQALFTHRATSKLSSPLSAADIGIAHHLFLQFISLRHVGSVAELETEAGRLEQEGILSPEQRRVLDLPAIAHFWASTVGQRIRSCEHAVHRELPFTVRMAMEEIAHLPGGIQPRMASDVDLSPENPAQSAQALANLNAVALPDEFIVVQGVIDLAVILPGEICLIDFKTDEFDDANLEAKAKTYAPQLNLYSLALGRIYRRPVAACWLHFLPLRRTVELRELYTL